ncbi:MAG: glycosyltransferase [Halioglobus sp.]|nr:glycosyltransferase [Halioglobus sp.]
MIFSPELRDRYAHYSNIQFLGAVPQSTLVDYYRRACAVILPSLAPETFGLTVVEAFACGTPAIVRAAGGNRETVDATGAGFVYSNDTELRAALDAFYRDSTLSGPMQAGWRGVPEALHSTGAY